MRSLALLFVKYGGVVLFFVLEALCMVLIVNYNQKQKEIWFNSANVISGNLFDIRDNFVQYIELSAVADSLAEENARLRAKLKNSQFVSTILQDSVVEEELQQKYTFIAAKIVNSSIHLHNNSVTINRGSKHGIRPHMGVIGVGSSGGIIGVVRNTQKNYSQVMSILHSEAKISAEIKRSKYHGFLNWVPGDPTKINVIDIPVHADVVKGDTIQTTQFSGMFPEGVPIGIVDDFWREGGSNYYTIQASLINDPSKVKYVYIINNLMKEELEKLEEEANE